MPIDRRYIGFRLEPFTVLVTADQLRRFGEAIGTVGPAAVAPPTYMKVVEGAGNSSRAILSALQIDVRRILHAEQEFRYGAPIRAGDHVTVVRTVSDIYAKKGGALELVIVESTLHRSDGASIGHSRQSLLVRNEPPVAPA